MYQKQNYLEAAKAHEEAFRAILDAHKIIHNGVSIDQLYEKYSEGNRYSIWTILDFAETEPGRYKFVWEDIAMLSGEGSSGIWTIEDGIAKHIKNLMAWMS